jgi:ubiquinone/menaquinone biosynthesis C-methylase UbiE
MSIPSGLEWTFDTVASTYEKIRPGYVEELYRRLFDYIDVHEDSRVIEVGSGGGQATEPILKTGCILTAVEYGEQFSALLKNKFKEYPKFSVITGKFEDIPLQENAFDLVFSASAFHWIPEKIGYEKVFSVLKNGGVFARFANHPFRDKGNPALSDEIDDLYDEYYNQYHHKERKPLMEYTEEQAREMAMIAYKYGFTDIQYALFHRKRIFSAKEYIQLLGTYSDHIAIEETIRKKFFDKIEEAICRHGGSITIYDTIDLQLARKANV